MKKPPGNIIILHKCTKNYDQNRRCTVPEIKRMTDYFSFWTTFCSFTPPNSPKNQNLEKNEKKAWRNHHFT